MMAYWFSFSRFEGFPTHYSDKHSPANTDILTAGILTAFLIVITSFVVILPAYNAKRRLTLGIYVIVSIFIGAAIILGNYGQDWESSTIKIKSQYTSASSSEMVGNLGLHIGFFGVNITLKGQLTSPPLSNLSETGSKDETEEMETINYNEHFSWGSSQGRLGFGPYASQISKDFRVGVIRGLPIPILQVAEYFTFDGEGIRFGRHYRLASQFCYQLLWCSFASWIIANIFFCISIPKGAIALFCCALLQFIAIIIWCTLRNSIELSIPFENAAADIAADENDSFNVMEVFLRPKFGLSFILVAFNAILCLILSIGIFILHLFYQDQLCEIFGIDTLSLFDFEEESLPFETNSIYGKFAGRKSTYKKSGYGNGQYHNANKVLEMKHMQANPTNGEPGIENNEKIGVIDKPVVPMRPKFVPKRKSLYLGKN